MSAQEKDTGSLSGQRRERAGSGYSGKEFFLTRQMHPAGLWHLRTRSSFKDCFVPFTLQIRKLKP